jgi:hypothetical protein
MKLISKIHSLFRHVNRGIALAIILAAGLVIYLGVDAARFDTEKLAIKDMVTAYAKESESVMILPESVQKHGENAPEEVIEQKIKEDNEIFTKYLTKLGMHRDLYQSAVETTEDYFKYNNDICAYVTECNFTITDISNIKKSGHNLATGDIIVKNTVTTIGRPQSFSLLTGASLVNEITYQSNEEIHTYSQEITFTDVIFRKVNDQWKVAAISGVGIG